ncbi:MAG: Omp28 family outer membrane lipoprotein [Candidatus Kapabacteria bacterium]|jgi:thiol-disulfide isomerase/thioredoxin|nr:Omp28 family outer membrane lipoprotein [Candidatus Kapabacteria bacterium]
MYKYKKILSLLALPMIMAFFASCDEIDAPYTEDGGTDPVDTTKVIKKVLLDEFTGIKCVNCPKGHEITHEIMEDNPDNVVVIAVHCGYFAMPQGDKDYDFRTADGNAWATTYGGMSASLPKGMINREGLSDGTHLLDREEWYSGAEQALKDEAEVKLELKATYDAATRTITAVVDYEYLVDFEQYHNLIVCVTEDGIIAPQTGAEDDPDNYVHNHAMRGCINGTWGEALTEKSAQKTYTYTIPADSDWIPENLTVIAIIQDVDKTYEVLQAEDDQFVK